MYPTNIKIEKINKIKIIKEKEKYLKDEIKKQIKCLLHDRSRFTKTLLLKLHI